MTQRLIGVHPNGPFGREVQAVWDDVLGTRCVLDGDAGFGQGLWTGRALLGHMWRIVHIEAVGWHPSYVFLNPK
jgi:hypothetical protein